MKKLIVMALAAIALPTFAGWQKIGTVQFADVNSLVKGVSKVGEFTGNPMLGLVASGSMAEMPCVKLFGEGRAKASIVFTAFIDDTKDATKALSSLEYAILYPMAQGRQQFLAQHPGSKVEGDVIRVVETEADKENGVDEKAVYVAFTKDGKWAAMSDKREQAKLALGDVKVGERPLKGSLARLAIAPKGMEILRNALDEVVRQLQAAKKPNWNDLGIQRMEKVLKDAHSLVFGIGIDDKGLAFRGAVVPVKGSELSKCGQKTLGADPLAFAAKDALMVTAVAADCGQAYFQMDDLRKVLNKYGLKLDFLDEKVVGENTVCYTLDVPATFAYLAAASNTLAKIDGEKLGREIAEVCNGGAYSSKNPAMAMSFAIKGHATPVTPAQRFAAILPEAAKLRPFQMQVFSLYSFVKALLPSVLANLNEADRATYGTLLGTLPPEGKGGIASVQWRDEKALRFLSRVSPDEFRSISVVVTACTVFPMQQANKKAAKRRTKQQPPKAKKPVK